MACLVQNMSWQDIEQACQELLNSEALEDEAPLKSPKWGTIRAWFLHQSEAVKAEIRRAQSDELIQSVWDFERAAMQERERLRVLIKSLMGDREKFTPEDLSEMGFKEKKIMVDAINALIRLQESGEKFMGIGSKAGNRYLASESKKDNLLDRVREVTKNQTLPTETILDTSFNPRPKPEPESKE